MKATILAVALAAAVLAGSARAAVSVTAETAFLKAQTCLKAHGALSVSNVGLIGGSARFSAGAASWRYLVTKAYPLNQGKVLGVKSYAFSVSMKPGTRVIVRRCVVASTRG